MYIKFVNEENKNKLISYWLLLITFFVALMIIVGGLTRLTDSGLSITKWDLISGILPPLTINDWELSFLLYKETPEFKLLNSSMTIGQFKYIFWWEYSHRLLGRIIGLFFLFPLLFLALKNSITNKMSLNLFLIFFLILVQGFLGWYMVESGLVKNTDVSHYRLSLHLTLAFIIFILLLWSFLIFKNRENSMNIDKLPQFIPFIFLLLLLVQISLGALVSGLDGGKIYQSWPLMNESFYPDDSSIKDLFSIKAFETPSLLQFIHRNVAYLIIFFYLFIVFYTYKFRSFDYFKKNLLFIFLVLILQTGLGIFTVLSGAQIIIASAHQLGSILLVTSSVLFVFRNSKS